MSNRDPYPLHGGQLREIAERFGIPLGDLLDFSANINPSGPPASLVSTLRASLDDPTVLAEYPDLKQTELKKSLARYSQTNEENVIVANGFVPLLEAALHALKIRSCLLSIPAFVEYRRTLEHAGVEVIPHVLNANSQFRYDAATMLTSYCDAILLANPQNPSGICHDLDSIQDVVARASKNGMYILVDEAFIDYVPERSLSAMIDYFPKLIVFRSVTKFYGVPGLRVAYALANPALSNNISDNVAPWPITTLASRAVTAVLNDQEYADRSRLENSMRREALQCDLETAGLTLYPSAANFVLFNIPSTIDPYGFWEHMILKHHIVLRSCANYESLSKGHFRAAVRTECENQTLALAVRKALCEL